MIPNNQFFFIGLVYDDAFVYEEQGVKICKFTLAILNDPNKLRQVTYIPIYARGNKAVKIANCCRCGTKVAVNGKVETFNTFDSQTGVFKCNVNFISDGNIYIVSKPRKTVLDIKRTEIVNNWFFPEEEGEGNK